MDRFEFIQQDLIDNLKDYTHTEIQKATGVSRTTLWRFLKGEDIALSNFELLYNFIVKENQND